MIYLDSSAILKLIFEEAESAALETWLQDSAAVPKVSSELAKIEVLRASRRLQPQSVASAQALMLGLDLVPLSGPVVTQGCSVGDDSLRSLDAIHLASALTLGQHVSAFVTYDQRLARAGQDAGLPTVQPGLR